MTEYTNQLNYVSRVSVGDLPILAQV